MLYYTALHPIKICYDAVHPKEMWYTAVHPIELCYTALYIKDVALQHIITKNKQTPTNHSGIL